MQEWTNLLTTPPYPQLTTPPTTRFAASKLSNTFSKSLEDLHFRIHAGAMSARAISTYRFPKKTVVKEGREGGSQHLTRLTKLLRSSQMYLLSRRLNFRNGIICFMRANHLASLSSCVCAGHSRREACTIHTSEENPVSVRFSLIPFTRPYPSLSPLYWQK